MADIERYWSLLKRQQAKLAHARVLVPIFQECQIKAGPNPSANEVARWLNERGVPPSADAKTTARWVAQTVLDYLYMDGIDPTSENIRAFSAEDLNQSGRQRRLRDLGFRFSATLEWAKVRATLEIQKGRDRLEYEERRLADHMREIAEVARVLRSALRVPEL